MRYPFLIPAFLAAASLIQAGGIGPKYKRPDVPVPGGMIGRGLGLTPGGVPGFSFSPPLGMAEMPAPAAAELARTE